MGIVNAMKTGNILLDMIIAMCIPIAIGAMISAISISQEKIRQIDWMRLMRRKNTIHERLIKHSTITDSYRGTTSLGGDSKNELLIKAIQLYLDEKGLLNLEVADIELKSFGENKQNNYYDYYFGGGSSTTLAESLSKYNVVKKPVKQKWVSLGMFESAKEKKEHEVNMIIYEEKNDDKSGSDSSSSQRSELTLRFQSKGKDSIDSFINKAYLWYLDELRKLEDDSRYMYELIAPNKSSEGESADTDQKYKRYQLSDEKTFDSLFFRQKENVMKIVDHFINKTGKYNVKGYPHKLGLLLHGPPGTGKTSLIKVLAQKTGRSIVNVPLARISTNAELASIFFDNKYYVAGDDVPITLGFKDVIFVMEDIDAVSKIVKRRDGKTGSQLSCADPVEVPVTKSLWRMILGSTDESCKELVEELMKKSERLKKAAQDPQMLCATARRVTRVPGLSLIGEDSENDAVRKVVKEATSSVAALMEDYETVNSFLGKHAQSLKQMIDAGSEINEAFENELLGISPDGVHSEGSVISLYPSDVSGGGSVDQSSDNTTSTQDETCDDSQYMKSDDDKQHNGTTAGSDFQLNTIGPKTEGKGSSNFAFRSKRDDLNLTGILNVLDGVVDTPGRMLIMTTNHPETLDPALIRPGRIDKKLMLGYMAVEDVVLMVEHYFQAKLENGQVERVRRAINGYSSGGQCLKLSPAQIEQMSCEFEEVEEMIAAIESKASVLSKNHCRL